MREKTIQHYRVTLDQAKRDYQDGLLTATGLVFYAIAILKPPGQKLRIKNTNEFADQLGIDRGTLYRVLSRLKLKDRLEWEPTDGLRLWIPLNQGVAIIPSLRIEQASVAAESNVAPGQSQIGESQSQIGESQSQIGESQSQIGESQSQIGESQSQIGESQSQIGESQSQIGESQSQIGESEGSKPASSNSSGNPTNTLTNDLQIFYKSLSNSEREKFKKFVDRKIEALPYKIALRQKWIAKNLEELESEFRETVGNRRSINLPNLEQMSRLQQMKDSGEIRSFGLEPYRNGQTIVVDDFSEALPWWEFFNTRDFNS